MDWNVIITLLISTFFIGLGCVLVYGAWKAYSRTRNVEAWLLAEGVITKSDVKTAGAAFLADMEYQYSVSGIDYTGTLVTVTPELFYKTKVVEGLLATYPIGKKVDVFYNPKDHHIAVLEKKKANPVLIVLVIFLTPLIPFLIGVLLLLSLL